MAREFRLPDLGSGLKEGQIVRWFVQEGDEVNTDRALCEVETEKAVIEIPVPFDGTVLELPVEAGETIEVGEVLAVIAAHDEAIAESDDDISKTAEIDTREFLRTLGETAGSLESDEHDGSGTITIQAITAPDTHSPNDDESAPARPRAMPSIRRMAKEHGIDLGEITGSGRHGRITRDDIQAMIHAGGEEEEIEPAEDRAEAVTESSTRKKLSMLRRTIAEHMTRSWREIPHVFTGMDVSAAPLMEARLALSDQLGVKIPLEALLIRATIPTLKAFPEFNATLDGDELILHDHYDIGVATNTPDGLIVPVIRSADSMSFEALVSHVVELLARTAERKTAPGELGNPTFTVKNIGALGHLMGTSIIPSGTMGILSMGRVAEKPVVHDGRIEAAPVMEVTLSFDHRVIDGGLAQQFMECLKRYLEQPVRFLV